MYQKVYLPGSLPDSCNREERQNYLLWTSKMDHLLAATLVKQVKEGNRVDGAWKPPAYTAALQVLNGNFGDDLTKEHVRSRLKTWKKQFRILKELLAHKGFEWDEAKKMVAAENSVWNNYNKAHPNARQYRGKFIELYDEWCIIMGEQAISTFSDNDAELKEIRTKSKDSSGSLIALDAQTNDKLAMKLRWTSDMDHYLGRTLMEYVTKGCKLDKSLQRGVLNTAVSALNEKYGPDLTKEHIRNRLKTWRKQYHNLKDLLSHDGFRWDETRKVIIANDSVWDDYIKINPEAKSFRGRVFENYDQFCIFFRYYNMEALDFPVAVNDGKTGCEGNSLRWTSEMDHCLRRVLMQHVIPGNKGMLDNKFNPLVYDAAILNLREMFALELTKDQVEDRFKSWKKEYGLLRDLLDQGDFEWDDQQKMLVAKDSVWDVSIERNPDTRQFRGKVIENYDELCVIAGCDIPSGSSLNAAADNLDLSVDEAINARDVCHNQSNSAADNGNYVTWTKEMDTCLSKLLVEQVSLVNKIEKNFKPAAYTAALTFFNERFALDLTKENIERRLNAWKKQYGMVKSLLSHEGFDWDEKHEMVVANDFNWFAYTKEHPDAREFQAKSIENYNELCMIFDNEQKTEGWSIVEKHDKDCTLNNHNHTEPLLGISDDDEGGGNGSSGSDSMEASSQQTGTRPSSTSHSRKALKRRHSGDLIVQIMSVMAANVARIADALSDRPTCLDQVFDVVQTMPGLDEDLILDACEFLSFDEKRAVMFMKLDERLRKKWLLKKLRS